MTTEALRSKSDYKFLDKLPYGVDEGVGKLALLYKISSAVAFRSPETLSDSYLQSICGLACRLDDYAKRAETLSGSFAKVAKKHTGKVASIVSESSVIFGAAAVGSVVGGPGGGVAATAGATFPQAFGASFIEEMHERDYDVKQFDDLKQAFGDKDFMRHARNVSYIHAAQSSTAIVIAGKLAGYFHAAFAKPVASAGASVARTIAPRMLGEFAGAVGNVAASGFKTVVNTVGKKAVQAVPMRAMFLGAAVSGSVAVAATASEHIHHAEWEPLERQEASLPQFPTYNTSLMYI